MGHQERSAGLSACREGAFDLVSVFVAVAGETSEVAVRDAGKASGLGDRELVRCVAERTDGVRIDSCVTRRHTAVQFAGPHPAGTVGIHEREEVRALRLAESAGEVTSGRWNGRSRGR
jgi:hypothetical protein